MISQERFDEIESEHGCGYYHVCWEKACPCAIVTENKGLKKEIYDSLVEESRGIAEEHEDDYYNDPQFDHLD